MANNRILLSEPNGCNRELPNTEDLSILVELKATTRGRSIITGNAESPIDNKLTNTNNEKTSAKTIGFLDGTAIGAGRRSLTTNYTEVNTNFSSGDEYDDLESLGIESINISFDTAYTPIVNIKFIDIRGQAVLSQGTNSKYKMFFELPYPIFELTVKGFYGKAVTYCLHLTKWNASFNSGTGNFEINADFIGYTYALLTDCLLGYMRATADTRIGKRYFSQYLSEYPNLITIEEFLDYVNKFGDEFEKLKEDNEIIQQLNSLVKLKKDLAKINDKTNKLKNKITGEGKDDLLKQRLSGLSVIAKPISDKDKTITDSITSYKSNNIEEIGSVNEKIKVEAFKIKIEDVNNIATTNLTGEDIKDKATLSEILLTRNKKIYGSEENIDELAEKIVKTYNGPKNKTNVILYDFRKPYDEVDRVNTEIKKRKKILDNELKDELKKIADKVTNENKGFRPTIRNIVTMLAIHAQVFLQTIREVSRIAESSIERKNVLTEKLEINNPEDLPIFAWPEYSEKKFGKDGEGDNKDQSGYYETWIGEALDGKDEDVIEVKFVEELLDSFMKIGRKDEKRDREGFGISPHFFPVSPLDAPYTDNLVEKQPYINALKGSRSTATPAEIYRCLLMRGFLGLGVSYRTSEIAPDDAIQMMGRLEAENVFDVIKSDFDKSNREKLMGSISSLGGGNAKTASSLVLDAWTKGTDSKSAINDTIHPYNNEKGILLKENGDDYQYTYIVNSGFKKTTYVPINTGFDGIDFFNESKTFKSLTELKTLSNEVLFTSDNNSTNIDDGSVFLKIIPERSYIRKSNNPSFGDDTISNFTEAVGEKSIITQNALKKTTYDNQFVNGNNPLNYYNGRYKTLEINTIIYDVNPGDDGDYKSESKFYTNSQITNEYGNEKAGTIISAYYYQEEDSESGTFLSRTIDSLEDEDDKKELEKSRIDWSNPERGYIVLPSSDDDYRDEYLLPDYGKQRELIGEVEQGSNDVFLPYVEFAVSRTEWRSTDHFSLFGSKWYYAQDGYKNDGDVGKAFLFLHCIPWQGVIGDINDATPLSVENSFDVSMFDTTYLNLINNLSSFESDDDTFTIKGLFGNNGSFIKAPKLWCAFIGALLYRYDTYINDGGYDIIKFSATTGGSPEFLLPWQDEDSYTPKYNEYLYESSTQTAWQGGQKTCGITLFFDSGDLIRDDNVNDFDDLTYTNVDQVILNLPKQVREEFKNVFLEFVKGDFKKIQNKYELFESVDDLKQKWVKLKEKISKTEFKTPKLEYPDNKKEVVLTAVSSLISVPYWTGKNSVNFLEAFSESLDLEIKTQDLIDVFTNGTIVNSTEYIEKLNKLHNYSNISPVNFSWSFSSGIFDNPLSLIVEDQFDLTLSEPTIKALDSGGNQTTKSTDNTFLTDLFAETVYIMNGSPRTFRVDKGKDIKVNKKKLELYLEEFFKKFNTLVKEFNEEVEDDKLQKKIFNNFDDDLIKLSIYRTLGSINSKWLGGDANNKCADIENISKTFRFLDSSFLDIGDNFLVNPSLVYDSIIGNYNQSFFDLVNKILIQNNFNFIALPSYVTFDSKEQFEADVFGIYDYKESINQDRVGPSFVCVYTGQKSTNLNLGDDAQYKDDGVFIYSDCDGELQGKTPEIFDNGDDEDLTIPYFLVSYGKGNQSIFKDVKLDQREFTETQESLEIIEDLSQHGNKRKATFKGQNLFNVYQQRAYSAEVEMMGCPMIQPMMYFQLNNIPMFRGAYLILSTSHNITAHNMSTTFKGSRIKNVKTPLIKEDQLLMNLIGSLEDVGEADTINNDFLTEDGEPKTTDGGSSNKVNEETKKVKSTTTTDEGTTTSNEETRDTEPTTTNNLNFIDPVTGGVITSGVGPRSVSVGSSNHKGIDISLPSGNKVVAIGDGTLELVRLRYNKDSNTGYGLHVVTKHVDNEGNIWRALYAHLSDIDKSIMDLSTLSDSQKNQLIGSGIVFNRKINKNTTLGLSGGAGDKNIKGVLFRGGSSGPHLHLEIRKENQPIVSAPTAAFYNNSKVKDPAMLIPLGYNDPKYANKTDSHDEVKNTA